MKYTTNIFPYLKTKTGEKPNISIIVPIYNEEIINIRGLIKDFKSFLVHNKHKAELILVDDGSNPPLKKPKPISPNIKLIRLNSNCGYGAAIKTGINSSKYKWIGLIDADGTYSFKDLIKILKLSNQYQLLIGARQWSTISLIRKIPKKILTKIASFFVDFNIPDLNSGLRIFDKTIIENHLNLFPDRFSFTTTLTMFGLSKKIPTAFVPIQYNRRIGYSKIKPIRDTVRFLSQIISMGIFFNPLRFFMPISALFLIFAILRGIRDLVLNNYLGLGSMAFFVISLQIFFFGLIAQMLRRLAAN